jgi:hypothetical protein
VSHVKRHTSHVPCRVLLIRAFVVWKEMVVKAKKLRMKVMVMMVVVVVVIIMLKNIIMSRAITQYDHL